MRDGLKSVIDAAESEFGPHPDLTAFLTVRDAVRESEGSDAARAYSDGAQVTLYSDEGHEYRISFSSLMDELLMLAAMDTRARLTEQEQIDQQAPTDQSRAARPVRRLRR